MVVRVDAAAVFVLHSWFVVLANSPGAKHALKYLENALNLVIYYSLPVKGLLAAELKFCFPFLSSYREESITYMQL